MRQSGKSFRAILQALYAASSGKNVFLITENPQHSFQRMKDICTIEFVADEVNYKFLMITLVNGYVIRIVTPEQFSVFYLRGLKDLYLVSDYEYYELSATTRYLFTEALYDFHSRNYDVSNEHEIF